MLVEFYMVAEWMGAFRRVGFIVMPHPYKTPYFPTTIHSRHPRGFLMNVVL